MSVTRSKARIPAWPFFLLGFLLPIDTIAGIPAVALDGARYGVAATLVLWLFVKRHAPRMNRLLAWGSGLLIMMGIVSFIKAGILQDIPTITTALISLISAIAALAVVRNQVRFPAILRGFALASVWSAGDILLQWAGLPFLGTPTVDDYRYAGFTFSSTHVAPLLAVALCIVLTRWAWAKPRILFRLAAFAILSGGLFVSQGRAGVAAFGAAALVWLLARFAKRPARMLGLILIVGIPVMLYTNLHEKLLDYILREDRPGGFTSGRGELNGVAWDGFLNSGFFGVDPSESAYYSPHLAPLTAALNTGVIGLLATIALCLMLAWIAIFASSRAPVLFRMIAAVALVTALIEPSGFFVGFSRTTLLMICLASLWKPPKKRSPQAQPDATATPAARQAASLQIGGLDPRVSGQRATGILR